MRKLIHLIIILLVIFSYELSYSQWQKTNGIKSDDINCLAVNGTDIFAGTFNYGIYLSTDSGADWIAVNNGIPDSSTVVSLIINGSNIFAGTYTEQNLKGMVFLSTNNGESWSPANNGLNYTVESFAISGNNIFAGTAFGGIYLSTDNGLNWNVINNGLPENIWVNSIAISGINIFAATYSGGIFLTTDNGESWNVMNSGLTDNYVYSIAIKSSDIFAGTNSGIFLSTNNGQSWKAINNGLLDTTVVNTLYLNGANIFAGSNNCGVFFSQNNGTSWAAANNGLTNIKVNTLSVCGEHIFAGINRDGVWKETLSDILGINESGISNEALGIKIYPDPVKLLTVISYQLSQNSFVSLKIYDVTGAELETLTDAPETKGIYHIDYNTQKLKAGVYFARIISSDRVQVSKFVKE